MRRDLLAILGISLICSAAACGDGSNAPLDSGSRADLQVRDAGDATAPRESGASDGPADCIDKTSAGHHQFVCDGLKYDVTIPVACAPSAAGCGLVLDVHGWTMSAQMQDANTNMRALGEKNGYIVVQPNAPGAIPSWTPSLHDEKIHAFVGQAIARFGVDTKRVHMTGFSQGGYMSWRFICKYAETFASVAPAAACGSLSVQSGCSFSGSSAPSRALPILYMHGTKDALVAFSGCADVQRDAVIAHFGLSEDKTLADDGAHVWKRYVGNNGEVFEFLQHDYASKQTLIVGHCFPGSADPGGAPGQAFSFKCDDASQAFNWGEVAMKFFIAHPRP